MDQYTDLMIESREEKIGDIMRYIPGGVHKCIADEKFTLLSMSRSFLDLIGYTAREIEEKFDRGFANIIYQEDLPRVKEGIIEQLKSRDMVEMEYRIQKKDGTILWILDKCRAVKQENGQMCFYCMIVDNTRQQKEREELRLSLERYQVIMDQATDIIFEWDIRMDTLTFSSNWVKKFGYKPITEKITQRIPKSHNIHPEDMPAFVKIMNDTALGVPYSETEFRIKDIWGSDIVCRIRATTQYGSDQTAVKAVGVITDISREKQQKQELIEQAQTDALTGLLNRKSGKSRIEEYIEGRPENYGILLLLDLDDFKLVNDNYGHLCGDALLSDVAGELKRCFRSIDVISRIGGDEFMIYLPGMREQEIEKKMQELLEGLSQLKVDTTPGIVSCSVGGACFPYHATDYYGLYKCADQALYMAKNQGKRKLVMFEPEEDMRYILRTSRMSCVSAAIDSEENFSAGIALEQYCFQVLYNAVDIPEMIQRILETVGRFYNVSRAYIFEDDEGDGYCSNTFEWCNEGICSEKEKLQNLRYCVEAKDYRQNFDEEGVFYCKNIKELEPASRRILEEQGIKSMLQYILKDCGTSHGFMGVDECRENRNWTKQQINSLSIIARIAGTFLSKYRLQEKLKKRR